MQRKMNLQSCWARSVKNKNLKHENGELTLQLARHIIFHESTNFLAAHVQRPY